MPLYDKISFLRKQKNMTQTDLAIKLDVTRQSVQKWESGLSCPDIYKLPELANLFGVSVDILLNDKIKEDKLMSLIYEEKKVNKEPLLTNRSMLDYLLLIPFGVLLFCLIIIFYLIGGSLFTIISLVPWLILIISFYTFILLIVNFLNSLGSVLLLISIILICIGLFRPTYYFAKWGRNNLKTLMINVTNKVKNINVKRVFK